MTLESGLSRFSKLVWMAGRPFPKRLSPTIPYRLRFLSVSYQSDCSNGTQLAPIHVVLVAFHVTGTCLGTLVSPKVHIHHQASIP
jgi:hypothetical protein